ncbi:hypothetical protein SAMN05660443_0631 [Marinospirillum celere]|uniref:Uncharacterized protein n=1 Tax=Marinospirillum celere TaxID=1122252 RepID=A0A1I1EIP7_9GAMM|nr:hypothetical protein [Marinospirillum celere]SFB86917.1 hypothetical protein SAMN05660443_0631 [Marinospirillum celere]
MSKKKHEKKTKEISDEEAQKLVSKAKTISEVLAIPGMEEVYFHEDMTDEELLESLLGTRH